MTYTYTDTDGDSFELYPLYGDRAVGLRAKSPTGRFKAAVDIKAEHAPAVALAILEAAGYEAEPIYANMRIDVDDVENIPARVRNVVNTLTMVIRAQELETETAPTRAQAESVRAAYLAAGVGTGGSYENLVRELRKAGWTAPGSEG